MRRKEISVTAGTTAGPEVVYGLLTDGATWTSWSPIDSFELERPGSPPPEGVGAVGVPSNAQPVAFAVAIVVPSAVTCSAFAASP